jgi:hypothetical protein
MWFTLLALVLFTFFGLILMWLPGILAKTCAIPMFLFCLPQLAGKWVIVNDSTNAINTFTPPVSVTAGFVFFYTLMLYIATLNVMDYFERDYLGRRRESKKLDPRKR